MQKSYKREMAVVVFLWFMYITEMKDVELVKILVYPSFAVIAAAFGLDGYAKLFRTESSEPPER